MSQNFVLVRNRDLLRLLNARRQVRQAVRVRPGHETHANRTVTQHEPNERRSSFALPDARPRSHFLIGIDEALQVRGGSRIPPKAYVGEVESILKGGDHAVEGRFVNGEFTMGENIGDLGGLQMAYTAYQRHLDACCDGEAPVIDGFTGEQRFFLAWAQVWRRLYREENLINRLTTDPHSPAQYRTNGVVRNLDVWYEAFGVTEENDLYLPPEERVSIW